ncbi:unnamed protein product [Candidula unifasciata]|uniref:Coiled-coil domain-containing protein 130 n=1 Tax=Candidula unifasciata TaxID=100452 RepID=A0A8S3Z4I7_9EUPU|nr:unnamed protein product [Candidula unifasciata]
MGVRYNAEKSKVGNYYSTPIYKFRMKCHLCDNYFEIQTDPKNHDYVILSGARRKEQRWDPVANEQVVPEDKATQKKLATDPMYKLEHGTDDQQKGKAKVMSLAQIEESRMSMLDDYILNRIARDKFRAEKKQLKEAADADKAILERASLDIDLVEESEEDKRLAGLMKYSVTASFEDKQKDRRKSIEQRPIFNTGTSSLPTSTSVSSPPSSAQASPSSRRPPATQNQGDLKNKLSRVLQATYNDPFQSVRKSGGKLANSFSVTDHSRLGIKLKRSKNRILTPSLLVQKKNVVKAEVSVKSALQEEATSRIMCSPEPTHFSDVSSSAPLTLDTVTTVTESLPQCLDLSVNITGIQVNTLASPHTDIKILATEKEDRPNGLNIAPLYSGGKEPDSTDEAKEGDISAESFTGNCELSRSTSADNLHNSNTGLQALISSYADSDSE